MHFTYIYRHTTRIKKALSQLDIAKGILNALPTLSHIEERLRRQSLLKSSLFSARIEGNRLGIDQVNTIAREGAKKDLQKLEVANIARTQHWLRSNTSPKNLSINVIKQFHRIVMNQISPNAGNFRTEPSAIFNQAGVAIYMTPPPSELKESIAQCIAYANKSSIPGPIKAAVTHVAFEKIHPFIDGNGRVGRLISTFILNRSNFDFRGLIAFEEEIEKRRDDYYDLLAVTTKDVTSFVEFFLEILLTQAEYAIQTLKNVKEEQSEDTLLPRRQELLNIIRDHTQVSFDFIHRRFLSIPKSTLHFDLKQLLKMGFIKKLGSTRGAVYVPKI